MQILSIDNNILRVFEGMYDESIAYGLGEDALIVAAFDDSLRPYKPAGLLISSVLGYSLMIEWLYVAPEYRRRRIGTRLVDKIMVLADQAEMQNAMATISSKNEGMVPFMRKADFAIMHYSGWHEYSCTLDQFKNIKKGSLDWAYKLSSLFQAGDDSISLLNEYLKDSEINVGVPLPIRPGNFSPASVCIRKNGEIVGLILVNTPANKDNSRIEMPWVYFKRDAISAMPNLYDALIKTLKEKYPGDTPVHFEALNEQMDKLIDKILPYAEYEEIYLASWLFG